MARITVEDCLDHVANRFELVILAAKRARQLMRGSVDPTVPWENDKATVVALREIASGHVDFTDAHDINRTLPEILPSINIAAQTLPPGDTNSPETSSEETNQASGTE